jgi:Tfp pilus assembly protein PilF
VSADAPDPGAAKGAQPRQRILTLAQSLTAARDLHKANRLDDARQVIQAAMRAAPGSADAFAVAAGIELAAGRPDLALPLAQRAAAIDGSNPDRHRMVGKVLRALGRDGEAAAAFDQALDLVAARPPSADPFEFNSRNPTHHLQARPVNHAQYRRSRHSDRLLASWLKPKTTNADDLARFYFLAENVSQVLSRGVDGALAELGVGRGQSARLLHGMAPGRLLYLFDAFAGVSLGQTAAVDSRTDPSRDMSLEAVKALVGTDEVVYCVGAFPDTVPRAPEATRFCLVHIDGDHRPVLEAGLAHFYPRLNRGGLLIMHDYGNDGRPGVAQCVDAFLADKPEAVVIIPDKTGTAAIVKQ